MSVSPANLKKSESVHSSNIHSSLRQIKKEFAKTKKYLVKNAKILGQMDGWDEAAVAASTILPAYARPLFLTVTLTGLTYPVSLGAGHMAAEFQEMKDDVQTLKNTQVDLALKLLASPHTTEDIKKTLRTDFDKNNANNKRHLEALSKVFHPTANKDIATQATALTAIFKKLDININKSDDHIEELLSKNESKKDKYNTVKTALDYLEEYKTAKEDEKASILENITTFITENDGTLEIGDNDWNSTKLKKITEALKGIADPILENERNEYIVKLGKDYYRELDNKKQLKEALGNGTGTEALLKALNITPPVNANMAQSDYFQYEKNKRDIAVEQTPVSSYLGNLAMAGMTLGTALSAAKAGSQLLGQFGVLPNLMPAMTAGLELASSGTFIASQVAMVGYGVGQAYKGIQKNNDLNNDIALLKTNMGITEGTEPTNAQQEKLDYLTQLQIYNTRKNTVYGLGIAAAEAGMIAGSLTGSTPLLMASALGTLAFAGLRMVTQSAEAELTGDAHDHEHNGNPIIMLNPLKKAEIGLPPAPTEEGHVHSASCNHGPKIENFALNTTTLNRNDTQNLNDLESASKELSYIISNNFMVISVNTAKDVFHDLIPDSQKQKPEETTAGISFGSFAQKKYFNKDEIYITAILTNPTALEAAKEILIDKFEDDNSKKGALKSLNSKRPDAGALTKILSDNLAILDKPTNAKKILKPLLQESVSKLKAQKHSIIKNMVHLQKLTNKERERESKP